MQLCLSGWSAKGPAGHRSDLCPSHGQPEVTGLGNSGRRYAQNILSPPTTLFLEYGGHIEPSVRDSADLPACHTVSMPAQTPRGVLQTPVDEQQERVTLSFSPVERLKERMPTSKSEVLQGTLDLLALKTLDSMGPLHGFGIALRVQQISKDLLQLNQGTLYPALLRLEQRGWITSKWAFRKTTARRSTTS
jgi:hypothetical protein